MGEVEQSIEGRKIQSLESAILSLKEARAAAGGTEKEQEVVATLK